MRGGTRVEDLLISLLWAAVFGACTVVAWALSAGPATG
jgi:hypothetical protein